MRSNFRSTQSGADFSDDDCGECEFLGAQAKHWIHSTNRSPPIPTNLPPSEEVSQSWFNNTDLTSSSLDVWPPRRPEKLDAIGNAVWYTIHTFAAYYPEKPTLVHEQHAKHFIHSLGFLFPCRWCADDIRQYTEQHPANVSSRIEFCQWTCDAHNHVNGLLGKPIFDCHLFDQSWRIENNRHESL